MPVIAMTGATGFVGRRAALRLAERLPDHRFRLLVRDLRRAPRGDDGRMEAIVGDLSEPRALRELVEGADAVLHIAGAIAGNDASDFDEVNVTGTRRLVQAIASRAPDSHLLHVSSLAAREPGLSWYAASKRAGEEIVLSRLERRTVLRPPAVYGPHDPALAGFWRWLARGWLLQAGPDRARFSLVHVDDLVDAMQAVLETGPVDAPLEIAGPEPDGGWSWEEVAGTAARVRGAPVRRVRIPAFVLAAAARAGLWTGRIFGLPRVLTPGKVRELLHVDWTCDTLALSSVTGWRPRIALEDALADLPGWTR